MRYPSIDPDGRIVIPKVVREAAGIAPGTPLEISAEGGRIEIRPAATEVVVRVVEGVAVATGPAPSLSAATVEEVLRQLRAERG